MPQPPALPAPRPPATSGARRALDWLAAGLLPLASLGPAPVGAQTSPRLTIDEAVRFAEQAGAWRRQLTDQVMPYWYDHSGRSGPWRLPAR